MKTKSRILLILLMLWIGAGCQMEKRHSLGSLTRGIESGAKRAGKGASVAAVRQESGLDGLTDEAVEKTRPKARWATHLSKVLPYDKEIAASMDIPEEELPSTLTDQLCWHCINGPARTWFTLYSDPNLGIERALQASTALATLVDREDFMESVIKVYGEAPIEVYIGKADQMMYDGVPIEDYTKKADHEDYIRLFEDMAENPDIVLPQLSLALYTCDQLLMYPPVFEKTKGHEKELLSHLCDRYRRMVKTNEAMEKMGRQGPYSVAFNTTKQLAMRLMVRLDPRSYRALQSSLKIEDEPLFFSTVVELVRTLP